MPSYAQNQLLKTYILSDPVLSTKVSGEGTDFAFVANALNQLFSPPFYVWRGVVSKSELRSAVMAGLGQLDNLTPSKRDALLWAVGDDIDFSVAATRTETVSLCGSQATLKAAMEAVQRRQAKLAEKVLATGTGSAASPATAGWEGDISIQDVNDMFSQARAVVK